MADRHRHALAADSPFSLHEQVALVTGAGDEPGGSAALALAAAGAAVVCVDRAQAAPEQTAARVNSAGGRALAVAGDLLDRLAIAHLATRVRAPFGAPSILVHSVSDRTPAASAAGWADSLEAWDAALTAHLTAPWLLVDELRREGDAPRRIVLLANSAQSTDETSPSRAIGRAALPATAAAMARRYSGTATVANTLVVASAAPADPGLHAAWQFAFAGALTFLASPAAAGVNAQTLRVGPAAVA